MEIVGQDCAEQKYEEEKEKKEEAEIREVLFCLFFCWLINVSTMWC